MKLTAKRINFINVQHGHGIGGKGYEQQPLRTGMERVLIGRMGAEFGSTAKDSGKVTAVRKDSIEVEYKDGTVDKYPLGTSYNSSEGTTYNHELKTGLKPGDKVSKHDVITYNSSFFGQSPFDPKRVDYLSGSMMTLALREAHFTLEDSCSLRRGAAERLATTTTVIKTVKVDFWQEVHDVVKVGDTTDLGTILCTISDQQDGSGSIFDDEARETLRLLSAMTPRAKVAGKVGKIDVLYNGDIEDMSDTLMKLTKTVEAKNRSVSRNTGGDYTNGRIGGNIRVDGHSLSHQQIAIQFYIISDVPMGVSDKLVFGNQMKSTVGEVMADDIYTESGRLIDGIFGGKSPLDRIITSPFINGLANYYLKVVMEKASDLYFGIERDTKTID